MLIAGLQLDDPDPLEPLGALVHDRVLGERLDVGDGGVVTVSDERARGAAVDRDESRRRSWDRRCRRGPVRCCAPARHRRSGRITWSAWYSMPWLRGCDHDRLGGRVRCGDETDLRGLLGLDRDQHEAPGARQPDRHEEPLVGLVEHALVLVGGPTEAVAPDLVGPHRRVLAGVEHGLAVGRPRRGVAGVVDSVRQVGPGCEVPEPQRVSLGAVVVDSVREQPLVVAERRTRRDAGIRVRRASAFSSRITSPAPAVGCGQCRGGVERALRIGQAAMDPVLAPLGGPAPVPPAALARRRRQIVLLDPALDLLVQAFTQTGGGGGHRLGVAVLGLQVGDHRRVVAVAEPVPVVDAYVPVGLEPVGRRGAAGTAVCSGDELGGVFGDIRSFCA